MGHDKLINEIERREWYNSLAPFPPFDTEIITDLKILQIMTEQNGYNDEPITYCKTCLSISIKTTTVKEVGTDKEDREVDYCIPCGNTDLGKAHVSEWEELYEEKYDEIFLSSLKK